ncbi:MAG: carboxypeptidase regulatory-like domain-containing protein [Candidatus Aminicenantia bacterium]
MENDNLPLRALILPNAQIKKQISKKIITFFAVLIILGVSGLILSNQAKAAGAGDVVINEIMWMGSSSSSTDEWIELRNASNTDIDLINWIIENASSSADLTINASSCSPFSTSTIPAGGYYLIANYASSSASSLLDADVQCVASSLDLNNDYSSNGALILKEGATTIDETPASSTTAWPAGSTGAATSSMARNYTPGDGTATSSWHTAIITTGWDAGVQEKGTPGSYNGYSVSGTTSQLNAPPTGTIYILAQEHGTTTATATATFSNLGSYQMHLFSALYDFFAFRDINTTSGQYDDGQEPRRSLDNSGAGYNLTSSGLGGIDFSMAVDPVISSVLPASTHIGDTITIAGSYFGNSTTTAQGTVYIPQNIDAANYISAWASTSISVVVPPATSPPGPQTGQLRVAVGWTPQATTTLEIKPKVTSAVGTEKSIVINFDSFMDGGPASNPANYTLQSPIGTSVSLSGAWTEFRGNKTYIKNLSLTAGNSFQITAGSGIKSINQTAIESASSTATGTVVSAPAITLISPNSGTVASSTTITGTGFGSATGTLYFSAGRPMGGPPPEPVQATTTSWSNTQIVTTVPPGAKTGPLFVTTAEGVESEFSSSAFFDVLVNHQIRVLEQNTATSIGSTNGRIVIGGMGGPKLYYVGDNYNTSYSGTTFTIPTISSEGFIWAFNKTGDHVTGKGQELDTSTTTVIYLATSTTKVSGTITNAGANRTIVVWSDPLKGSGEAMEWSEPIFIETNSGGTATYNIGLSATGTYIVGVEDPGFTTTSNPKVAPSPAEVNASTTAGVSNIDFAFLSATARIRGKIETAQAGVMGPGIFHVWGYQPIENGLHSSAQVDLNISPYFDLYVNPGVYIIGVGGPDVPFPVEKQIEVKTGDPNFALSDTGTDITLIIKAPDEYIEGRVTDSGGNAIAGASIFAWSSTGPGGGYAFTDSNGYYKMYVNPGTYTVEGFTPQYGKLTARTGVQVPSGCDTAGTCPSVDFGVSSEMAIVSGTVVKNDASSSDLEVWITQGETGYGINGTRTGIDGSFSLRVPYGSGYYLHVGDPGVGEIYKAALPTFNSSNSSTSVTVSINTANIYVRISPGTAFSKAFVEVHNSAGRGFSDKDISTTSTYREYLIEVPKPTSGTYTYTIDGGIPNYGPLTPTTTDVTSATVSKTISISLGNFYTIQGSISDPDPSASGNQAEGAFVWAASPTGHGGGRVDSSGNFSFKLKPGTYDFGIDKKNYIGNMFANVAISSDSTITDTYSLALTQATSTISGTVYKSGTAEPGAWVWATNGTGGWTGTQTDGNGAFTLSVSFGNWSVQAISEGYESGFSGAVPAGTSGLTITLTAISGYSVTAPTVEPIVPRTGGVIQGQNVKVEAPIGALDAQDSNTGRMTIGKTTSVPKTNEVKPLGGSAYEVDVVNSQGTSITVLNDDITITLEYSASDLSGAGITQASATDLSLGYFDSTTNKWVTVPTTVATTTSGGVIYTATTDHLSPYAPLVPSGANPPPTPTGLTATAGNQQITLNWDASTGATKYNIYRKSGDNYPYLTQVTVTTYTNTGLTNGTTYYYKVSALNNDDDESAATAAVSATPVYPTTAGGVRAPPSDTTAPSISNIAVTVGDTQATISWQTDEASLSWILYGTSTAYGLEKKTTTYLTSHSLILTNLTPETIYHYQVKSEDISKNIGSSIDKTFTTLALGAVPVEEVTLPEVTFEKPFGEMSVEEIQAKITEILEAIAQLEKLLAEIEAKVYEGIPASFRFERTLSYDETSDEVKYLQIILKQEVGPPTYPADVPATGWFGPITEASVIAFQEKYTQDILAPWEITEGTGFVGSTTRAKLNELLGGK